MEQWEKAVAFIERLKNPQGSEFAGRPIKLLKWQKDYIKRLLALDIHGNRIIRKSYLWIPKKNGKTTLLAALATYFLWQEQGGQIFVGSNDKEQASILYGMVRSIVEQDEWLFKTSKIYKGSNKRSIRCFHSNSELIVGSSEAFTKNGLNVSIGIFDEAGFFKDQELVDAIESSQITRSNPLILGISTAGSDTNSYGYRLFEQTLAAIANPTNYPDFLGIIYQGDREKWKDIDEWYSCNPSMKELGNEKWIRGQIKAAENTPAELRRILRYHLNCWIEGGQTTSWIEDAKVMACNETIDIPSLLGRDAYIGVDIATRKDLTCVVVLFALDNGKYFAQFFYFTPADTLEQREHNDKSPYSAWVSQKYLTAVPGDYMSSSPIYDLIMILKDKYNIKEIGIDSATNAADLTNNLQEASLPVTWVGQGWKTVVPTSQEIEKLIMAKLLITNNNPMFRWNMANCRCKIIDDAGNLMPSKKRSVGRIDGISALIDALFLEMQSRNKVERYEAGGIFL